MARKMDAHKALVDAYRQADLDELKHGQAYRAAQARKKKFKADILVKMGASTVATLNDQEAFEITKGTRDTFTKEKVLQVAPELYDDLVTVNEIVKIKWI